MRVIKREESVDGKDYRFFVENVEDTLKHLWNEDEIDVDLPERARRGVWSGYNDYLLVDDGEAFILGYRRYNKAEIVRVPDKDVDEEKVVYMAEQIFEDSSLSKIKFILRPVKNGFSKALKDNFYVFDEGEMSWFDGLTKEYLDVFSGNPRDHVFTVYSYKVKGDEEHICLRIKNDLKKLTGQTVEVDYWVEEDETFFRAAFSEECPEFFYEDFKGRYSEAVQVIANIFREYGLDIEQVNRWDVKGGDVENIDNGVSQ